MAFLKTFAYKAQRHGKGEFPATPARLKTEPVAHRVKPSLKQAAAPGSFNQKLMAITHT
jgi:hypothetical protein